VRAKTSGRHSDGYTALKDAEDAHAVEVAQIQARIPSPFVAETRLRIDFYRKLALADSTATLKQIEADLRDRFGKFGDEVKALLLITGDSNPGGTKRHRLRRNRFEPPEMPAQFRPARRLGAGRHPVSKVDRHYT